MLVLYSIDDAKMCEFGALV